MTSGPLLGRTAFITGGTGGIGFAMARGLSAAGAAVIITGRNQAKGREAVSALRDLGREARFMSLDLGDPGAIDAVIRAEPRLDILINNAGTTVRKLPQDMSLAEWQEVLQVNLTAAFTCAQAAYTALLASGNGKIINVGSMFSLFGAPQAAAYGASKGGLVQLTRSLATAWAKDNIQVNAILPGYVATEMTDRARIDISGLNERVMLRTPAGRWGKPEDFEAIAVFLSGSGAHFITGAAIPVDGGYAISG